MYIVKNLSSFFNGFFSTPNEEIDREIETKIALLIKNNFLENLYSQRRNSRRWLPLYAIYEKTQKITDILIAHLPAASYKTRLKRKCTQIAVNSTALYGLQKFYLGEGKKMFSTSIKAGFLWSTATTLLVQLFVQQNIFSIIAGIVGGGALFSLAMCVTTLIVIPLVVGIPIFLVEQIAPFFIQKSPIKKIKELLEEGGFSLDELKKEYTELTLDFLNTRENSPMRKKTMKILENEQLSSDISNLLLSYIQPNIG